MNNPYVQPLINKHNGVAKMNRSWFTYLLLLALPILVAGCSGGDVSSAAAPVGTSSGSTTTSNGNVLYLSVSKTSILSNNSDSATITCTVVKSNVPQQNVAVTFSTTGGLINSASATTDSDGKAIITFKSGPRASNQIVSVTASSGGASAIVPIQITGNTLALSIPQTNMSVGDQQILTAKLLDATPLGIADAPVIFAVVSGANVVSLSNNTVNSNYNGEAQIAINGALAGSAVIMASSLGVTAQISVTVAAPAQSFDITSPTVSPASLATDGSLLFTVRAPTQANVTFQTTVGLWNGSSSSLTVPVILGVASATLTSTSTGLANVTAMDAADPATKSTFRVNVYAPASQAASITLDASQFNLPISLSGATSKNSSTLTATVRTAPIGNQPGGVVGNAQVNFTLANQPGGGEELTPGTATTDNSGTVTSTFTSGTLETGGTGVRITATVAGTSISNYVDIVITNRPGSIVLGRSTKLSSSPDNTYYSQVITVQVADVNGTAVTNTRVYLKLWPIGYYLGYWAKDARVGSLTLGKCLPWYTPWTSAAAKLTPVLTDDCLNSDYHANEDANKNLALDLLPIEDDGPMGVPDTFLTPPNSAAGTIPAYVTTDDSGMASFEISYLKLYASWIKVHLEASTSVQGSESQASLKWILPVTTEDADTCESGGVFPSPFGFELLCNKYY